MYEMKNGFLVARAVEHTFLLERLPHEGVVDYLVHRENADERTKRVFMFSEFDDHILVEEYIEHETTLTEITDFLTEIKKLHPELKDKKIRFKKMGGV